ncbi:site-specific integrase [Comamonas terrae]|uniref:Tyrosine-type recombinase/integrase n=1 Tax=Comamonas terrae TaxID=673548 RepID=A0ABW5UM03_9BURK|nr:site-specific integrase [Comamonas terrae]
MGTITQRKSAKGAVSFRAQIRLKEGGELTYSESKTFTRRALAQEWLRRREAEIEEAQATGQPVQGLITLKQILQDYVSDAKGIVAWGRSKTADITRLQKAKLAHRDARHLRAIDFIEYAKWRRTEEDAGPATVLNDIVWLRQACLGAVARYGMNRLVQELDSAKQELLRLKIIAKPRRRIRRLRPEEEAALKEYFAKQEARASIPMLQILEFALLTTRRQEEITTLKVADVDFESRVGWLDDVKHPKLKTGNRRCFRMLEPALELIKRRMESGQVDDLVFPYNHRSISSSFTRACKLLNIPDLRFHDLRHEAISRLFERGYSIEQVAQFSLHESWASLKIYTHLDPADVPELSCKDE